MGESDISLADVVSAIAIDTVKEVARQGRAVAGNIVDNGITAVTISVKSPSGAGAAFTAKLEAEGVLPKERPNAKDLEESLAWVEKSLGEARFSDDTKAHLRRLSFAGEDWLNGGVRRDDE